MARSFPSRVIKYGLAPGLYSLSVEQAKLGVEIHVVCAKTEHSPSYEQINGIAVHRVRVPYNIFALKKIIELNKRIDVDIIHAHHTSCMSYTLLRRFLSDKPYIIHVHDTTAGALKSYESIPFRLAPGAFLKEFIMTKAVPLAKQRFMWKRADVLIAVSNSIARELHEDYGVPEEKIRVVYNAVDVDLFKPAENKNALRRSLGIKGQPVILFVGHYGFRKGPHYLIKAAPTVLRKFPEASFVLVGGTPPFLGTRIYWQILRDLSSSLNVQNHINLVGSVSYDKVFDYYSIADVFVLPTLYEGLPKVVLEAMACQLPVVTTNVSGNPEVVTDGETGLLVKSGSVSQLADALIRVLSDPKMAEKMGVKGRKRIKGYFTWEKTARKIVAIYEEMLPR